MKTILITGATGNFGRGTINFILDKGIPPESITAFIRDMAKAEDLKAKGVKLKTGDYDDYASMIKAFRGTDKLLLISGSDVFKRTRQQEDSVKAAKEAGVKHVVYTSFQRKNETASSPIAVVAEAHIKTEKWLKESGMIFTIMKNNLYMDGLPMLLGEKVLESGIIYQPAGDGKTAFTLRNDMAEAAAQILTTSGHENKVYNITSDIAYSYNDISAILSDLTGKPIRYISPQKEEFIKTLTSAGVPEQYARIIAGFSEGMKQGEFEKTGPDLQNLIGRKPTLVKDFLKEIYSRSSVK
jgi:NAD(P)H dehydrogenase (quinone)